MKLEATKRKTRRYQLLIAVCFLLFVSSAHANIKLVASNDWESGSHDWTSMYGVGSISEEVTMAGETGAEITFTASDFPETDIFRVDATNLYAGSWTNQGMASIEFDFWASNETPSEVAIRWSSSTSSYVWGQDVSIGGLGWTSDIELYFDSGNWTDWRWDFNPSLSSDIFLSDLGSIDWIGVYIISDGSDATEIYGIDNFQLWVPEPSQYIMLAATAITAFSSLRRRRKKYKSAPA